MPLGILQDHKLEHVPGTAPLSAITRVDIEVEGIDHSLLKHDPSGKIVLVPQPSDSQNDPYNWPRWNFGCGVVGAVGPLLTSAFVPLAKEFGVTLSHMTMGANGSLIALIAIGSIVLNTLSVKIGKRPIYVATSVGLVITSFWAGGAKSFNSFCAARAIQGFCMAPMEALVPASIADVWFVHERGYRTAIFNLGVLGGINLASPIAGSVIQYGSYRIAMYAVGGAFIIQTILTFFFMPETAFHRVGALNIDSTDRKVTIDGNEKHDFTHSEEAPRPTNTGPTAPVTSNEPTLSYWQELKFYSGYYDKVPFWRTLIRPFFMLLSPIVLWATILFTTCISWLVLISITLSQIFSAAPYNFSISDVGLTNLSSFVATVIGTIVASPLIDGVVKYMSKRNNGTFEPEFRLPIMVTYIIFTAPAFFAWGQSLHLQEPWPIPVIVCMGLINLGIQLGTTGVVAYVSDCHREQAAEGFSAMNFVKNMFAFGMTFYANNWIAVQGVRDCFFVIGGITIGVVLLTVPMYIFGKKARSFVYRHQLIDSVVNERPRTSPRRGELPLDDDPWPSHDCR